MSRASHVPYHQNVYDLLGIEPGKSPEAARMIAEHEAQHGPLPASVREWYLVPNIVRMRDRDFNDPTPVWEDYRGEHLVVSLHDVLYRFEIVETELDWSFVCIANEDRGMRNWFLEVNGTADPPVWSDNGSSITRPNLGDWSRVSASFGEFIASWFTTAYPRSDLPSSQQDLPVTAFVDRKPHANGLWLRSPDEPFQPPVIDLLMDHFGEPERTARPDNVTTYAFRPPGGTIRVTADEPALTGGLSAWWIHADTSERLAEFAELLLPWGTLRETLRADTDPARDVLKRVRGA